MTSILALDLGTKTGWAVAGKETRALIASGMQELKTSRYEGGGMRFLKFRHWLDTMRQLNDFDAVYFEEVRGHKGVDAAHVYGGLLAVLSSWCEEHRIPYLGVPVGEIKKHATGKGNCGKEPMKASATQRWRIAIVDDDNEADALCLLAWALEREPPQHRRQFKG